MLHQDQAYDSTTQSTNVDFASNYTKESADDPVIVKSRLGFVIMYAGGCHHLVE